MNRTVPNPFMPTAETIAKYSRRVEKAEVPAKTLLTRAYRAELHARGLTSKGKPYIREGMKKRFAATASRNLDPNGGHRVGGAVATLSK